MFDQYIEVCFIIDFCIEILSFDTEHIFNVISAVSLLGSCRGLIHGRQH